VADALARGVARYPQPDLQWIEDRIWVWVHYITCKINRGELFEAIDGLSFVRARVLGPLILLDSGVTQPHGMRRIERAAPQRIDPLRATLAKHDAESCRQALAATIDLYADLRDRMASEHLVRRGEAERAAAALAASRRA